MIAGESMFNDGLGVVIFSLLLAMLASGVTPTLGQGLDLLVREAGGGLRGGISVALALSLPMGPERNTVVALTYGVVVFSILAQGLSIGHLSRQVARNADQQARSRANRAGEL